MTKANEAVMEVRKGNARSRGMCSSCPKQTGVVYEIILGHMLVRVCDPCRRLLLRMLTRSGIEV